MAKLARIAGTMLLFAALAALAAIYGAVWYYRGFWALYEILAPPSRGSLLGLILVAPGIALILWAERRED